MLTFIVVVIIIGLIFYCGYVWGDVSAANHFFDEKKELIKAKDWWQDKCNDALEDLKKTKSALKDAIVRNDDLLEQNTALIAENDTLTNKLSLNLLWRQTIEMKYQEEIIDWFNQWISQAEIARKLGCGASTISRAIKKFWLVRQK